jgi:hypothetical protein
VPDGGPPPLRPFGLLLHHDGRWSHEGVPIRNARLRACFDRSVRFLAVGPPEQGREAAAQRAAGERSSIEPEGVFVVQLGRFRGQIEVEEAAFFVRDFDPATGAIRLSDGTSELLDPAMLRVSARDGAGLCTIKRSLAGGPARALHPRRLGGARGRPRRHRGRAPPAPGGAERRAAGVLPAPARRRSLIRI